MVKSDIQDLWGEKEARKSVKITYPTYGWHHLHLPATGAKVSTKSQAVSHWRKFDVQCIVLLYLCSHIKNICGLFLLTWAGIKTKTKTKPKSSHE